MIPIYVVDKFYLSRGITRFFAEKLRVSFFPDVAAHEAVSDVFLPLKYVN